MVVSNVLSRMLNTADTEGRFEYHPSFHKVDVTHLIFQYDILMFSNGKQGSVAGIMEVFKEFAVVSGLNINASKSSIFTAG